MSPVWFTVMLAVILVWLSGITLLVLVRNRSRSTNLVLNPEAMGLRYWSLVKFNPFGDTGGNHSFVICLLDAAKNGIILTSLHGRGVTRFYAKQVAAGRAENDLSGEEKQALNQALK